MARTLRRYEEFRERVLELLEEEVVVKFDKRDGTPEEFYSEDEVEEDG